MPFKSKQQMKWAFSTKQKFAKEWADKTKDKKHLPKRVSSTREKSIKKMK